MSLRLSVRQRSEQGGADKATELGFDQEKVTLGRDPACEVVLPEPAVSRHHARISRDGALYFLEDLGSACGTQVNGQPLPKGEKRLLRKGDVIVVAQFDVVFERIVDVPKVPSEKTSMVARQM